MQIINVVEIINGLLNNIDSFPIYSDLNRDLNNKSNLLFEMQVEKAEKLFLKKCRDNGCEESDEKLLNEFIWDDDCGYSVMINYSNSNV